MNSFKQSLGFCLLLLLFFLLPTGTLAEDVSSSVQKKAETVGRVTLESKEYPLDHYKIEADIGDSIKDTGDRALHSLNQAAWGFNKTIASFTLYSVDQLMSFDLISNIVEEIGTMSERIYEIMSGTFLSLFVILVGGTAAWRYFVNQQVGHAIKAILGALAIMVITFWFYSNTTGNIKWLNDRGAELEGIASSANVLISSDEFNGNAAYNPKEGIAVLENQLFNLMVKRPYLLLNYGSTKESEVVSEDPNRVDSLLEIKPYTDEGKEQRADVVSNEVERLDNKYMTAGFSGERFGYLTVTIISTIALSIPILLLGMFKFLLQIWFLALVIFTAIPLVLSLIPSYSETAMNHGKKLTGVLLMKAGLVLLIAVITGLVTLLYESVKVTNGVEGYAFVVFLICITIWGLFKYRSEIFEVASAGMIQGQQLAERMAYSTVGSFGEAGEKGVSGVKRMTKGAYKAGGMVRGFLNQQGGQQEESSSPPSSTGRGRSQVSSPRSSKRTLTGRDPKNNGSVANPNGKTGENKIASVVTGSETIRSASRSAGAAVVSLRDYKNEKGEETAKGVATNQSSRGLDHTVSKARKSSPKPGLKSQEGGNRESLKTSEQPARGTVDHVPQKSSHRNPAARMESQKEVAATRESVGHLTQWEVQQKLDAQKANVSSESQKRSEKRHPKGQKSTKEPK